jgi:predicted Na+-dependent transporter
MSFLRALTVGAFGITILLAVLVEGMVVTRADVGYVFSKPGRLVRTILAMHVLGPIVAISVCRLFDLHPALIVALVTLSMTPVGALFPQGMLPLVRTERGAHAHGLFVATTVLSVVLTPLAVEVINVLYGEGLHLSPLTVTNVAVGALLLPLGMGLVIGRFFPAAKRWVPAVQQASGRLFLLCLVGFTILGWSRMALIIREGTLPAIIIISMCGLAVGHLLGGPDEDDRTVLAFATVSRHPGVAIAIAVLTREPLAPMVCCSPSSSMRWLWCLTGSGENGCVDETPLRLRPLVCIEVWSKILEDRVTGQY